VRGLGHRRKCMRFSQDVALVAPLCEGRSAE
jgi:hypothetical protein